MRFAQHKLLVLLLRRAGRESLFNKKAHAADREQFLETPRYGARLMAKRLRRQGYCKRIRRLMLRMGLEAIYQKPNTSTPHPGHKVGVYLYLLSGIEDVRPDQFWCADIMYIPMRRGYIYLVAVMDWYGGKVLSCRLSNTLESQCVAGLPP